MTDDIKPVWVDIPEWGEGRGVYVRPLSASERDQWEGSITVQKKSGNEIQMENIRARLVVLSACDDMGKQMFTGDHVEALGNRNSAAIDRIFKVAQKLSGIDEEAMKELSENFSKDPKGEPISELPESSSDST
jgi:hypothetical protein